MEQIKQTTDKHKLKNLEKIQDEEISKEIKEIITRVLDSIQVLSIYFFRSGLYKSYQKINDLDFLIIVSDEIENTRKISRILNSQIERLEHPCDFLVVRHATLEKNKNLPFYIYKTILEEGVIIYE